LNHQSKPFREISGKICLQAGVNSLIPWQAVYEEGIRVAGEADIVLAAAGSRLDQKPRELIRTPAYGTAHQAPFSRMQALATSAVAAMVEHHRPDNIMPL
jgi:hypothetical protein